MSPQRLFITGTDTDVGKTIVAGLWARATGRPLAKPLASGLSLPGPSDAEQLHQLSGRRPACFQTWEAPVAPHRAALLEDRALDRAAFLTWLDGLAPDAIVEGVGGWAVPAAIGLEMADVAQRLKARVLIVAADRLGVLNHTRLTVDAVRTSGCSVLGVVLNQLNSDDSTPWNLHDLRLLLDVSVVPLQRLNLQDPVALTHAAEQLVLGFGPSETLSCP